MRIKVFKSKRLRRKMATVAPKIVEIDMHESIKAFRPTTFSVSTNSGGRERIAGLNKLVPRPTKKPEINKAIKREFSSR